LSFYFCLILNLIKIPLVLFIFLFCFVQYQVRTIKAISRHWHLASLAYTFLEISKLNGSFSRIFHQKPKTTGKQLEMFRKLNSLTATHWIMQNYKLYQQSCLGIQNSLSRGV